MELNGRERTFSQVERLFPALILVLFAIAAAGAAGLLVTAWPFSFGDLAWRVRTSASLYAAVPEFAMLMVLACIAGVLAGQRRAVRAAAVVLLALAALLTASLPLFALDFLSERRLQTQTALRHFTREGLRIAATTAVEIPFLAWAALRAWSVTRKRVVVRHAEGEGLVVGRQQHRRNAPPVES